MENPRHRSSRLGRRRSDIVRIGRRRASRGASRARFLLDACLLRGSLDLNAPATSCGCVSGKSRWARHSRTSLHLVRIDLGRQAERALEGAEAAFAENEHPRAQGAWANIRPMDHRLDPPAFSPFLYRYRNLVERFFNNLSIIARSPPDTRNTRPTISPSSSSQPSASPCGITSRWPSLV